jgi:hypothetical protein
MPMTSDRHKTTTAAIDNHLFIDASFLCGSRTEFTGWSDDEMPLKWLLINRGGSKIQHKVPSLEGINADGYTENSYMQLVRKSL